MRTLQASSPNLTSNPVQDNPSITYVSTYLHNLVMKIPYLNWFVQPFDEAVHRSLKKP